MAYYRINRISEEIRKEISNIIRTEVKDPRISDLFTIVKTEVTGDLRYAKVYVSVLGTEEQSRSTLEGLKKAAGFIRRELGSRLDIRYTPELLFVPDHSIEYSVEISRKLNELHQDEEDGNDR
jgi:ribosome-binding factor A